MNDKAQISAPRIRQIVSLIDLTNLRDDCDNAAIEALCAQATTSVGQVAAVCVWPVFVPVAKKCLSQHSAIKIATVVNFPGGNEPLSTSATTIEKALREGADEIDYVIPYAELIKGNIDKVHRELTEIRNQIPDEATLKIILETGELASEELIRTAADISIDRGADFIKTSTGKVAVNATPEAAIIMLDAIAHSHKDVGFKAAGGISTIEEADAYLKLSEDRFGKAWVDPMHFRFGASSLLQNALMKLNSDTLLSTNTTDDY